MLNKLYFFPLKKVGFKYRRGLPDSHLPDNISGRPSLVVSLHEALHAVACVRFCVKIVTIHAGRTYGYCLSRWPNDKKSFCRDHIQIALLPKMFFASVKVEGVHDWHYQLDEEAAHAIASMISGSLLPFDLLREMERKTALLGKKRTVRLAAYALAREIRRKRVVGGAQATRIIRQYVAPHRTK